MEELLQPATLLRLERLVSLARRAPARRRRGLMPRRGRGVEPGSRRDYTPGDDPRWLDWPAYARLEKLLVKVTEELPEPRLTLLVDGSGSMGCGRPAPLLRASLAAAGLAACALARGARVELALAGATLTGARLERPGQLVRLLGLLSAARAEGTGRLAWAAEGLAARARDRGAAVLLSDGLDPQDARRAALRLRNAGFTPAVVTVGVEGELDPAGLAQALEAGEVELAGAEVPGPGGRRVPFAAASLARAAAARAARQAELVAALSGAGVELAALPPDAPFEQLALAWLRTS